jgi:hypothetical protein
MPSFDHLYITIDPLIRGSLFVTWGPKRDYRLLRLRNGVSVLIDPQTYAPMGVHILPGMMTDAVTRLPLVGVIWFEDRE